MKRQKKKSKRRARAAMARERDALNLQRLLAIAAAVTATGIYMVGTHESEPGMILVLTGLLGLMVCIHRYGRLGEDGVAPRTRRVRTKT